MAVSENAELPNSYLWTLDENQILTPETALDAPQAYQIIEGKVRKAASHKNVIYLNFGDDWRTDFTLGIKPSARRLLSREGYKPLEWVGHTVQARGWLESYNGPFINIDHPEQITFIDEDTEQQTTDNINEDPGNALPDIEKFRP